MKLRLALAAALTVVVLGAAIALVCYTGLRGNLERELEALALHEIEEVAAVVASARTLDDPVRRAALERLYPKGGVLSIEVWSLEGDLVYAMPTGAPTSTPWAAGLAAAREGRVSFIDLRSQGGPDALRAARLVRFGREPRWLMTASVSRSRATESLARFVRYAASGLLAATGLVFLGSLAMLSVALRPAREPIGEARTSSRGRGRHRGGPPAGSERGDLACLPRRTSMRPEEPLGRLRRFTANASRELRTPLIRMRSQVESALRSSDPEMTRSALGFALEELDSLRRITDGLLDLAQAEQPIAGDDPPIDLSKLVAEVAAEARGIAREIGADIEFKEAPSVTIRGNRVLLARALWHLINNAMRASAPNGRLRLSLIRMPGDRIAVDVEDDGPGLEANGDPDALFEPFVRGEARPSDCRGFGLGLAVSRAIARRHAGTLSWARSDELGGARLRLVLPAAPEGPQPH